VFGAAVRASQGRIVGGVAVVFDTAPQLAAMLRDSLPRDEHGQPLPGCVAMFLDRELRVVATSGTDVEAKELGMEWIRESGKEGHARVVRIGDNYHAIGV